MVSVVSLGEANTAETIRESFFLDLNLAPLVAEPTLATPQYNMLAPKPCSVAAIVWVV
jgi:hypothetical protein